jgi:hypothetical protein
MKKLLVLISALICFRAEAQTYTQMQWGMDKSVSPYQFGANINGTWSNLGTVSSTGVWSLNNLSYVPGLPGSVTTTIQAKLRQTVSIKDFGATGDGTTYDTAAFTAAFALTTPTEIYIPAGTYRIACSSTFVAAGSISLVGDGKGVSVIKLDPGCTIPTSAFFDYSAKSNVEWSNLTVDLNTPAAAASTRVALRFTAYSGNADKLNIHDIEVKNATSPILVMAVGATGGRTYSNVVFENNYVSLTTAATTQNQCIALTTLGATGYIPSALIAKNTCVNSGIQTDGAYTRIIDNDVSGFAFGTGIFTAYSSNPALQPSSRDCIISGNVMHDSPAGLDVNNTPAGGLENNCYRSLVVGNLAYNLGGPGFLNYGSDSVYEGNTAFDNGKNGTAGGTRPGDPSGFFINESLIATPLLKSERVTFIGNVAFDSGAGTQLYGLYEKSSPANISTTLRGNSFTGTTLAISSNSPISSNWEYISEKYSVSTASFEWTGLDKYTAFRYWQLDCNELAPANVTTFGVQVGQGATPTWQTGANYTYQNYILSGGGPPVVQASTVSTSMLPTANNFDNTQTMNGNFTIRFGDLTAPGRKLFMHNIAYQESGVGSAVGYGNMFFTGNTNPITAIRLVPGAGNFKARCTLMGRP